MYLPTAVPFLSVTSMVKGTANSLSVLRTSTWFSPSGTEYAAGSKNTVKSVKHGEEEICTDYCVTLGSPDTSTVSIIHSDGYKAISPSLS